MRYVYALQIRLKLDQIGEEGSNTATVVQEGVRKEVQFDVDRAIEIVEQDHFVHFKMMSAKTPIEHVGFHKDRHGKIIPGAKVVKHQCNYL